MKVRNAYNTTSKMVVPLNMLDRLEDIVDKLASMMRHKLTVQGNAQDKQFKSQISQRKRRGQMKHDYDQGNYQTRNRVNSGNRRMIFRDRGRGRFVQNCGQNYRKIIEADHKTIIEMTLGEEIIGRHKIIKTIIKTCAETMTETIIECQL